MVSDSDDSWILQLLACMANHWFIFLLVFNSIIQAAYTILKLLDHNIMLNVGESDIRYFYLLFRLLLALRCIGHGWFASLVSRVQTFTDDTVAAGASEWTPCSLSLSHTHNWTIEGLPISASRPPRIVYFDWMLTCSFPLGPVVGQSGGHTRETSAGNKVCQTFF